MFHSAATVQDIVNVTVPEEDSIVQSVHNTGISSGLVSWLPPELPPELSPPPVLFPESSLIWFTSESVIIYIYAEIYLGISLESSTGEVSGEI